MFDSSLLLALYSYMQIYKYRGCYLMDEFDLWPKKGDTQAQDIDSPWYCNDATEDSQIISSRVRLARNIQQINFSHKLTADIAEEVVGKVKDAVDSINQEAQPFFKQAYSTSTTKVIRDQLLLEEHILSPKYLETEIPKTCYTSPDKGLSFMVNEEDHIRIQSIMPGRDIQYALTSANILDDMLEQHLDFAFDPELGYLTSCPTNVGTGLRASFLIHLPCLDKTELLKKLFPYISKAGMTLRGIYGEGTISMGNIFQLSNQVTLGLSEEEIIENLENVATNIIKRENETMDKIMETRQEYLKDKAYRAYGILSFCRRISVKEAMHLLSDIRLGFYANVLDMEKPKKTIYQLMIEIQPGHMHNLQGGFLEEEHTDIARADYLRKIFKDT